MSIQLKVPSLGESITEATLGAWLKKEGEPVQVDEPLVEVESEKATVSLPAPAAGVLRKVIRKTGETVAIGEVIGELEEGGAKQATAAAPLGSGPQAGGVVPVARDGNGAKAGGAAAAQAPAASPTSTSTSTSTPTSSLDSGPDPGRERDPDLGPEGRPDPARAAVGAPAHGRARRRRGRGGGERPRGAGAQGGRAARPRCAGRGPAGSGGGEGWDARAGAARRAGGARARRRDDAAAANRGAPARRGAAHRRHPDDLQRGRHVAGPRAARAARGGVPRPPRREARVHVVLREGGDRGAARLPRGERRGAGRPESSTRTTTTSASPWAGERGSSSR